MHASPGIRWPHPTDEVLQQQREYYEATAAHPPGAVPADVEQALATLLASPPVRGRTLAADLGCGLGRWTGTLAGSFAAVDAVDYAPSRVAAGRARTGGAGIRWIVGDCCDYEAESQLDLVLAAFLLTHLPTSARERLVARMVASLAPGGAIVVLDHTPAYREQGSRRSSVVAERQVRDEIKAVVKDTEALPDLVARPPLGAAVEYCDMDDYGLLLLRPSEH